jgi:hypothetical protein
MRDCNLPASSPEKLSVLFFLLFSAGVGCANDMQCRLKCDPSLDNCKLGCSSSSLPGMAHKEASVVLLQAVVDAALVSCAKFPHRAREKGEG